MPNTAVAINPRRYQCRHIFTDGRRCGSPCLLGEDFCFYHFTAHTRRAIPTIDLSQGEHQAAPFSIPVPEDRSAVQLAIGEVLNRLAANELDPRRAGLLLYGLQIASLNLPQTRHATQPAEQGDLVEETVIDPTHGTLAPRTELLPPDAPLANSLIARLLEDLHRTTAEPQSEPAILPNLEAAAAPAKPRHRRSTRNPRRLAPASKPVPNLLLSLNLHAQTHRSHHP